MKKSVYYLLPVLLIIIIYPAFTYSNTTSPGNADAIPFFITTGQVETQWESRKDFTVRRRAVDLNGEILQHGTVSRGDKIAFTLFDGETHTITVRRTTRYVNGAHTISGRVDGMQHGYFTLSYHDGKVLAAFKIAGQDHLYRVMYDNRTGDHHLIEMNRHLMPRWECGGALIPDDDGIEDSVERYRGEVHDAEGPTVIDIMIVYTPAAVNWASQNAGSIQNIVAYSMARFQESIDNSEIDLVVNLVYSGLVDYTESASYITDLNRITSPTSGYMDEVHDWRNAWAADLVALFAHRTDIGGVAWLLTNTNGSPANGFSLTTVNSEVEVYDGLVHAHEVGHNMGNHHSRNQSASPAPPGGGLFVYSTGWRWVGADDNQGYASVMTYPQDDAHVPIFSNPDVDWAGTPSGSYTGTGAPADNARSMSEIKEVISNYRTSAQIPVLVYPADGAGDIPIEEEFEWESFPGASAYRIQVADDPAFEIPVVDEETTGTDYIVTGLYGSTQYYWRVQALNEAAASGWSDVRTFTTEVLPLPDQVVLAYPGDLETIEIHGDTVEVILGWNPGHPGVSLYEIDIMNNGGTVTYEATDTFFVFTGVEDQQTYEWRVRAENSTGWGPYSETWSFSTIVVGVEDHTIPVAYNLMQNYPNPFNPSTVIRYGLPERSTVTLSVYNAIGQRIATLVNGELDAGYHETEWHSGRTASGMYFYRLEAYATDDPTNRHVEVRSMILLK